MSLLGALVAGFAAWSLATTGHVIPGLVCAAVAGAQLILALFPRR